MFHFSKSQSRNNKTKRAFTLVELLVVIAVIGLLAAVAIVALGNARVKSRDARKMADIKQITNALEIAFSYNNSYPNSSGTVCLSTCLSGSPPAWCSALLAQMSNIPNDPLPSQRCYLYNSDGLNFRVAAEFESAYNYAVAQGDGGIYPQFYEGQSSHNQILLTDYKSVWPTVGLAQLDPSYSSLVGWWEFEEGTGGAGSNTADFSSQENIGTLSTPPPTWQSQCVSGGCLSFDGASNYVNVGNASSLNITGNITLEGWVRLNSAAGNQIVVARWSQTQQSYEIRIEGGVPKIYLLIGGAALSASGSTLITGAWYHLVGTYDGSNIRMYVNGVSGTPTAQTGSINGGSADIQIGGRTYFPGYPDWLSGSIEDVRIHNAALTASQICHLCKEKRSTSFCNNCTE